MSKLEEIKKKKDKLLAQLNTLDIEERNCLSKKLIKPTKCK